MRVNAKFAFIELRSIEECNNALSLNGIPFMGQTLKVRLSLLLLLQLRSRPRASCWCYCARPPRLLTNSPTSTVKVGRPSKYAGVHTPARTWQELTGQLRDETVVDPSTKLYRELFVGNTTEEMTDKALCEFIAEAMVSAVRRWSEWWCRGGRGWLLLLLALHAYSACASPSYPSSPPPPAPRRPP